MEEYITQPTGGLVARVRNIFRPAEQTEEVVTVERNGQQISVLAAHRYHINIRKGIVCFDDAIEAARGLKNGEQQILDLTLADPSTRQKIIDFLTGVNFAEDGTIEEIGKSIFLIAPAAAYVETVPSINPLAESESFEFRKTVNY